MIDPALDHDHKTEPANERPTEPPGCAHNPELGMYCARCEPINLISAEQLAELAIRAELAGQNVTITSDLLRELVRLYRRVSSVAAVVDKISQISEGLERQVAIAASVAESMLRRATQRFEVLVRWGGNSAGPMYSPLATYRWHETPDGLRWSGSFDEACGIVRDEYGPKRGTEAFIVVRVDQ